MIRYFEDLEVEEINQSSPYHVTAAEIIEFAKKYDPQPFHLDRNFSRKTQWGCLIASGPQFLAFWRMLDDQMNGDIAFICGLEYKSVKLLQALKQDTQIYLVSKIADKRLSRKNPQQGVVEFDYELRDINDTVLMKMNCSCLVSARPNSDAQ